MATMTATQQSDIRADLGIADGNQTVFTDAEFDRLYTRAGSSYNSTVVMALRQLLMDAAKRNSYKVGQTSEELQEIFENLQAMLDYYENVVVNGEQQVRIVGMRPVPYAHSDRPWGARNPLLRNRRYP